MDYEEYIQQYSKYTNGYKKYLFSPNQIVNYVNLLL